MESTPDRRAQRIATNEALFRDVNDRLEADLQSLPHTGDERFPFVCECARVDCRETIPLSFREYETVRADAHRFAIAAGHEIPDVEDVVERQDGYWVIEKRPPTHPITEMTDPRRLLRDED